MAYTASIGDIVLLAQLALKLGHAFTKGRKSAPAELHEVENQLYSLSAALHALHDVQDQAIPEDSSILPGMVQEGQRSLKANLLQMLENCEATLQHLQGIVQKYTILSDARDPDAPFLRKWGNRLRTDWNKIRWTTEGGNLSALRSQLTVHTNSLSLMMGAINSLQTNQISGQVTRTVDLLSEIHTWFVNNLQGKEFVSQQAHRSTEPVNHNIVSAVTFNLYLRNSTDTQHICENASICPTWNETDEHTQSPTASQRKLFLCLCRAKPNERHPHQCTLDAYQLSPFCFPVRLAGDTMTWMLHNVADRTNDRLIVLTMNGIAPQHIAQFEQDFVRELSISATKGLFQRGLSTDLAYIVPRSVDEASQTRILHLVGDLDDVQKRVNSVEFSSTGRSYSRDTIKDIRILYYQGANSHDFLKDSTLSPYALVSQDSAEIVISYDNSNLGFVGHDIEKTILHLRHNTRVVCDNLDPIVTLPDIDSTGYTGATRPTTLLGGKVTFHCSDARAAKTLQKRIEEMRMELFILRVREPQLYERTILKLQSREIRTDQVDLADSHILVVQNLSTNRLRLIAISLNGGTILSQILPPDFFESLTSRPNFKSPTYVIQILNSGTRKVFRYPEGFRHLEFSDVQMNRLFELGLAAISEGGTRLALPTGSTVSTS